MVHAGRAPPSLEQPLVVHTLSVVSKVEAPKLWYSVHCVVMACCCMIVIMTIANTTANTKYIDRDYS